MHVLSEYSKHEHMLTKVDARVKLFAALAVLIMVLSYTGLFSPSLVTLSCLFLCIRMRIPLTGLHPEIFRTPVHCRRRAFVETLLFRTG